MTIMTLQHLEYYVGDRLLFKQEGQLHIGTRDRIGVVGRNGAGKSTLLAILAGRLAPEHGTIASYGTVAELEQASGRRGSSMAQRPELHDQAGEMLKRWEVSDEQGIAEHGSGGEKTRLSIAKVMAQGAELLIADEPTSHLDIDGAAALAEALAGYPGAVIVVSHDRTLLDQVCTRILELEEGKLALYEGNYSAYREAKEAQAARARFEYEQYAREKDRLTTALMEVREQSRSMKSKPSRMSYKEANLGRARAGSSRARVDRSASILERRLSQLEVKSKPREAESPLFDASKHVLCRSKHVLRLANATLGYGSKILLEGLHLNVKPGMRIALVGRNGIGKTTLLKLIHEGGAAISYSPSCRLGYFRQDLSLLREDQTILQNVLSTALYDDLHVRTVLARTLFKRDEVHKAVRDLSGGERVKTTLAKLFLGGYNTLLLDEPTNYLDLFARESLEETLAQYPGTILFASHDRAFVRAVATHLLRFGESGWQLMPCGDEEQAAIPAGGGAPAHPNREQHEAQQELMQLELAIANTLGRLSMPQSKEDAIQLDLQFQALLQRKRELMKP
ncbi:macrolide transport system ATP-binding/permease protein [Paenibacillus phyllosphaerae]|uniref:Macrolide transport system ATP-binding/permease protein n=1 Tax=Paenibacillus phyllosphaerae TaxID=274593 RepID=A0A7W5AWF2_9BACL|nr:ABC-F type ribosomal protection protein [Paenibacillus phyllosphaerae]MBB3109847.1 macrolide transport system ATP-binding/permease protein [Paenibacillus phyllosphaerae]